MEGKILAFLTWVLVKLGVKDMVVELISNIKFEQIQKIFTILKNLVAITVVGFLAGAIGGYFFNHYLASRNPLVNNYYCHSDLALENSIYPNEITLEKNAIVKAQLEEWKADTPEIHTIITYFGHNLASDSYKLIGNTMWTKTRDGIKFPFSRKLKILDLSLAKNLRENCVNLQEWIRHERMQEEIKKKAVECEVYPVKLLSTCPILMLMSDPLIDLKHKPLVELTNDTIMYVCVIPHSGSKNTFMFSFSESSTNYSDTVKKRAKLLANKYVVN